MVAELLSLGNANTSHSSYPIRLQLCDDVRVAVTSAERVYGPGDVRPSTSPGGVVVNYTALFIAVPVIVLILIVLPIVVKYYIK